MRMRFAASPIREGMLKPGAKIPGCAIADGRGNALLDLPQARQLMDRHLAVSRAAFG
ncbi:hypothetical protein [Ancylobacter terrae]|uniref:hypothetical protein n=1 Tax=Ancylobacter sp. sgz301288 TaxID=3342077 RepID=UPI00385C56E7